MKYSSRQQNNVLVVSPEGDLLPGTSPAPFLQFIDEQIASGQRLCLVDISAVRYINSMGIGLLTTLLTRFRNRSGEMVIIHPSEQVQKLLILTKLNAIFTIAASEGEAFSLLNSN